MLLREQAGAVLAIGQASHAWLSGQIARAWGNASFPAPAPYEEVCLAAEQHDIGMAAWDLWPDHNPETGLPVAFTEMDLPTHLALWSSAPEKLLSQSRYAATLVSMHGCRLYAMRDLERLPVGQADAVRAYLRGQHELQQRLLASLRADPVTSAAAAPAVVARASQLLWTWDMMSLAVCLRWPEQTAREVPAQDGPVDLQLTPVSDGMAVAPWPFSGFQLIVRVQGQRLTGRFDSREAIGRALAAAPWETLELRLSPGQP